MSAILVILGLVAGFFIGFMGAGGFLILPMLVYIAKMNAHDAVVLSALTVLVSALTGIGIHKGNGRIKWKEGAMVGAMAAIGAYPGTIVNHVLDEASLMILFGIFTIISGLFLLYFKNGKKERKELWILAIIGLFVGFLAGLFGVGGGFVAVPSLIIFGGFNPKDASATSLFIISLSAFSSCVFHWSTFVNLVPFDTLLFVFGAVAGVFTGVFLTIKLHPELLKKSFSIILAFVGVVVILVNLLHI